MRRLLIDGYSLLHRDPELAPLLRRDYRQARERLIRKIDRLAPALAVEVEIVFDGRDRGSRERVDTGHLQIVYSPADKTADTIIEQMVHEDPDPVGIWIVTADRLERETVTARGAQAMSCAAFLERLEQLDHATQHTMRKGPVKRTFSLSDAFPPAGYENDQKSV